MEVQFEPTLQAKLEQVARATGRTAADLVQDAVIGYVHDLAATARSVDERYDEIRNGTVQLIDGEEAFTRVRENIDASAIAPHERVRSPPRGLS